MGPVACKVCVAIGVELERSIRTEYEASLSSFLQVAANPFNCNAMNSFGVDGVFVVLMHCVCNVGIDCHTILLVCIRLCIAECKDIKSSVSLVRTSL